MLGRQELNCVPSNLDAEIQQKYRRCIFEDMKIAIDHLKKFNDSLRELHPDVHYKIRQLI